MKSLLNFLLGIIMCGLGVYLLLDNITVSSLNFYRLGSVNTAPVLIILLILFVVIAVVKSEWWSYLLIFIDFIGIIISVIMGTSFHLKPMSAFTLILMVVVFAVGLGLIIKSLFGLNKAEKGEN